MEPESSCALVYLRDMGKVSQGREPRGARPEEDCQGGEMEGYNEGWDWHAWVGPTEARESLDKPVLFLFALTSC